MLTVRSLLRAAASLTAAAVVLGGCASLPTSGPTVGEIQRGLKPDRNLIGMHIVDVTGASVADANRLSVEADSRVATLATLATAVGQSRAVGGNDLVGPGDVLAIDIYEVGATLFGGTAAVTDVYDPTARGQLFPAVTVDRDGTIKLPYVPALHVAGKSPAQIESMIERGYRGKSQSPQALVAIKSNVSQAVYVTGDTRKPGKIELSLQNERLLDAVALAGGAVTQTQDMLVRFTRGGRTVAERLDQIVPGAPDDLVLAAGDRIELLKEPQTFVSFGASGRVFQTSFDQVNLTLAEAIARAGGPNDGAANPKAVFLFRYVVEKPGQAAVPVIYRLNMLRPDQYFLSQHFAMRDKDIVYVSNAAIGRLAKFLSVINSLASPAVTASVLAQQR